MKYPYRLIIRQIGLWLRRSMSFLWLVIVAAYFSISAGQAVYRNYQSHQETVALQKVLEEAELERERLGALLVYYQTDSFKEKELRRALLMKRPGEKVYALPESSVAREIESELKQAAVKAAEEDFQPIWQQWIDYILRRK